MSGRTEGGAVERCLQHAANSATPHTPLPPRHRANARSMRKVMTPAELKLWNELRALFDGAWLPPAISNRGYIVDFACPEKKLVVEVDGSQHADPITGDQARTLRLEQDG
ncbi:DUF559 domain-containing protein [Mesorhizobium sp. M8A.F.Ca.ET.173.01.1.1]|nr:DUF559 domain-containing protein [Mesorhizobium sp. M8A.F.Ca.ET.173.01.1.1]